MMQTQNYTANIIRLSEVSRDDADTELYSQYNQTIRSVSLLIFISCKKDSLTFVIAHSVASEQPFLS